MYLVDISPNIKECRLCKKGKPETTAYFRWRHDNNKFRNECIECDVQKKKEYRKNNLQKCKKQSEESYQKRKKNGKHKNNLLQNKFNITLEEYNKMFEEQKGCCKLCKKHQTQCKRALAVDHCHEHEKETGEVLVRGLLCDNCNLGLGNFKDNLETLELAIKYLKNKGEV